MTQKLSQESQGSLSFAYVYEILSNNELSNLRKKLGIDKDSRIIVLSTEGDTDPNNYRKITSVESKFK